MSVEPRGLRRARETPFIEDRHCRELALRRYVHEVLDGSNYSLPGVRGVRIQPQRSPRIRI